MTPRLHATLPGRYDAGMSDSPTDSGTQREARPNCNIELKAWLASIDTARVVAESLADHRMEDQHQIDTYFCCESGRLKLRQIVGVRAELIAYQRPNQVEAKASRYYVLPIESPERFIDGLTMTLGIRCRVEKHREIYLHRNVRIHLDVVEGLGDFVEFEAVLGDEFDETESTRLVNDLREQFELQDGDLVDRSYENLIAGAGIFASR